MKITIIGSGNAATVLGKLLTKNNYSIHEVAGRNKEAVTGLATQLNARVQTDITALDKTSDIYIIAVKDDAVAEVSNQISIQDKIVLHTCGSVGIQVLANTSERYGVLYPLQSLRKELSYLPSIPFLVDGSDDAARQDIFQIASSISSNVIMADDALRLQYHLTAIIVSNFSNHLFALAKQYCEAHNTDFKLLLPLIEETVNRMHYFDPAKMQTGPAARGDESIIQKHLQLLNDAPQLKNLYEIMTRSIQQTLQ